MRLYVANTDYDWYRYLLELTTDPGEPDEVNFWRPSGKQVVKLAYGDPFVFKLKKKHAHAIVGFGLWVAYVRLSVQEAWATFGQKNGAPTRDHVWRRIVKYVGGLDPERYLPSQPIGCDLLASPILFPEDLWVHEPSDWADQIVAGKTFDPRQGEGRRIWEACLERATALSPRVPLVGEPTSEDTPAMIATDAEARYGAEQPVRPRLGQGTFRFGVQAAYGKCAVTREHSLPALEAAHIVPYAAGGAHEISNGLLLRADVHRLFDRGYVTVSPDYHFRVSSRLDRDYHNGKVYYQLEGTELWLPDSPEFRPDPEHLERHSDEVFLAS